MKRLLIFISILSVMLNTTAQNVTDSAKKVKNQLVSSEYDRNSLTIIGLTPDGQLGGELAQMIDTLKISDKFYANDIGFRNIPFNEEVSVFDKEKQDNVFKTDVLRLLNDRKVGQAIIAQWFNRQPDGSFNTSVMRDRGIYNSDDSDLSIASASKRGESALMDAGLGLIDNSYILVLGLTNLMTMDEYYNKKETKEKDRILNGVKANVLGMLYKLDFTDSVAAVFFQNMWASTGDENLEAKKTLFESTTFPLVPVKNLITSMESSQFNPGHPSAPKEQKTQQELLAELLNNATSGFMNQLTFQVADFKVKAQIYQTKPIAIKIGRKEGLGFDQRYFVYENRETRSGQQYSQLKGVIKSMSVADNRTVTTGETDPSYFYQIAGGSIDNMGMFAEQRIDAGVNLFLGYQQEAMDGITGRIEYYLSRQLYGKSGKIARGLTSLKVYLEGAYNRDEYTISSSGAEDVDQFRISLGVNKDFYLTSNVHLGPFAGYGIESATGKTSDYSVNTDFVEAGARLGINIRYNIQLVGSATYYLIISPETKDKDGNKIDLGDYDDIFPDRSGLGFSVGLRFML